MRRIGMTLLLTALAACSDAPAPAAAPPGPLDARAAAIADEVGRILGEPFDGLPAVEVRPMEEIRERLTPDLAAWCPLPGDLTTVVWLPLVGAGALDPSAFALPGEDRILVAKEIADGPPDERDRALARALAATWCGRRLRLPGLVETPSLPARWARKAAAHSLMEVAERRLCEARGEPVPEATRSAPTEEERRDVGPLLERWRRPVEVQESAASAAFETFAAALIDRYGLADACREVGRRPPSTYREILRPGEYLAGTPPADPAAESAARVPAILEGGIEFLGALPLYPETAAALLGREEPPEGFVGGAQMVGSAPGRSHAWARILLLIGETPDAAEEIRDALVAAERAANEKWDWLSTEESGVDGGFVVRRLGRYGPLYLAEDSVVLSRGRLVLHLRLSSPEDYVTDGVGLARRVLAQAHGDPVPAPEPWELRWRELGRAARYAEALADPEVRIRRRAAARGDAMEDPARTPWAVFRRAAEDPDPVVREKLLRALPLRAIDGKDPAAGVTELVLRGLADTDPAVRLAAANAIGSADWTKEAVISAVARALNDPVETVWHRTLFTLATDDLASAPQTPSPAWAPAAIDHLEDGEPYIRGLAARLLGRMPKATPEIRAALEKHADDPDADVREAVADAKKALGIP